MPFLVNLFVWLFESWFGKMLIKIVSDEISSLLTQYIAKKKEQADNAAAAKVSVLPLKNAKTGAEVEKATDPSLDGT